MQKPRNSYCYVSTLDHGVAESSRRLGLVSRGEVGGRRIFFSAPEGRDDDYLAVLNDIGDYDVDRIKAWLRSGGGGAPDFDSLVSAAFPFERGFACTGDFWGINSHYWFRDGTTFCCSDNVFLAATIAGRGLSRESLWEYLFFLSPAGDRTWVHDVRKLRPGETILYDAAKHDLAVTDPFDIESALRERAPRELNDALSGFSEPFLGGMIEYIADTHGARLKNVNTPDGFEAYRSWAFEFIPGRIFSGIILLASRDHGVYQPLISPMILGSLHRRGLGFVRDLNFRAAFGGPVSSLEPEALIVRETDRDIFENVLDRGVSFREVLVLPPWRLKLARKRRNMLWKLRNRNFRFGQVDNRAIRDEVGGYAQSLAGSHPFIDELLRGERWNKEAATLGMILESIRRS